MIDPLGQWRDHWTAVAAAAAPDPIEEWRRKWSQPPEQEGPPAPPPFAMPGNLEPIPGGLPGVGASPDDALGEDPGVVIPALHQAADSAVGYGYGLLERVANLPAPVRTAVAGPLAASIANPDTVPTGTRQAMKANLDEERLASLEHGNADARAAILGAANLSGGVASSLVLPGSAAEAAAARFASPAAKAAASILGGTVEGAFQGWSDSAGAPIESQIESTALSGLLGGLGGGKAVAGELARWRADWTGAADAPAAPLATPTPDAAPAATPRFEGATARHEQALSSLPSDLVERLRAAGALDEGDTVTGYLGSRQRVPAVERASEHVRQTGEPASYVEIDLRNLGGGNAKLGHSTMNGMYREFADIVREEVAGAAGPDTAADFFRHGGDETSVLAVGPKADPDTIQAAMLRARDRIDALVAERGLSDLPHSKVGGKPGLGINFAVTAIDGHSPVDMVFRDADTRLEKIKKGGPDVYGEATSATGPLAPGGPAGSLAGGTAAPGGGSGAPRGVWPNRAGAPGGGRPHLGGLADVVPLGLADREHLAESTPEVGGSPQPAFQSGWATDLFEHGTPAQPGQPAPLALPEAVELARELEIPLRVRKDLGEGVRGAFYPHRGAIDVLARLPRESGPEAAAATLTHEIGHAHDWLDDQTLKRGNVLGRLTGFKPIADAVGELNGYLRDTVDALPTSKSRALTEADVARLRAQAVTEAKTANPNLTGPALKSAVAEAHDRLLASEVEQRGLVTLPEIRSELLHVSRSWREWPSVASQSYHRYRASGKELYADFVSAYLNAPRWLREQAPKAVKLFEAYLPAAKPDVQAAHTMLQERMRAGQGEVLRARDANLEAMIERGRGERLADLESRRQAVEQFTMEKAREGLGAWAIDTHAALYRLKNRLLANKNRGGQKVTQLVEEERYLGSRFSSYLSTLERDVLEPARKAGVSEMDLSKAMFLRRAGTERSEHWNPLGRGGKEAADAYAALLKKNPAVGPALDRMWAMRRDWVIEPLRKSGALSDALMQKVENNRDYARFFVQEHMKSDAAATAAGWSALKSQMGTLKDVGDPFVETALQDYALMRLAHRATTMDAVVDLLSRETPQLIKPAETVGGRPQAPGDPTMGLITSMKGGKVVGYVVPKNIARGFELRPDDLQAAHGLWQKYVHTPLRALLVTHNPAWAVSNTLKDTLQSAKNIHAGNPVSAFARAAYYTGRSAAKIVANRMKPTEGELAAMREMAILPSGRRAWDPSKIAAEGDLLTYLVNQHGDASHRTMVRTPFARLAKTLEHVLTMPGELSERANKLAAWDYLSEKRPELDTRTRSEWVRNRAGTPNSLRAGQARSLLNSIFMFSNIKKEGWRASWESYRDNKASFLAKATLYDVAPKIVMAGAAAGLMGTDLKKLFGKIPEYDKENYTIIPIGFDANDKAVYFRVPHDHLGQAIGAGAWKVATGRMSASDLFQLLDSQLPWGAGQLHPVIQAAISAEQYASGKNPYDPYRGRPLIPEAVFRAGGAPKHEAFARAMWQQLGLSVLANPNTESVDSTRSWLEQLTRLPILGSVLQRFVKVSDYGEQEQAQQLLDGMRSDQARGQLERDDAIEAALRAHPQVEPAELAADLYVSLQSNGVKVGEYGDFKRRLKVLRERLYGTTSLDRFEAGRSKKERAALEGLR